MDEDQSSNELQTEAVVLDMTEVRKQKLISFAYVTASTVLAYAMIVSVVALET